jgi:SfnB family sulfur acquisition oxidoreductase
MSGEATLNPTGRSPRPAPPAAPEAAVIGSAAEAIAAAHRYAAAIRPGAVARDRDRILPAAELADLAATGLLSLLVPVARGGPGLSRRTITEVFTIISAADGAIGQIPQNHYQFVDIVLRYGTPRQQELLLGEVLRGARFGNAVSERTGNVRADQQTVLRREPGGRYRLTGRKYYSTGALTAQRVPVRAADAETGETVAVYVPRDAPGLAVEHDWTAFGQRATISGTTILDEVAVDPGWIIRFPGEGAAPDTMGAFGQVLHAAVDVGIARGALADAVGFVTTRSRPALTSGVDRAADEPHVILRFGQLQTRLHAAEALLDRAARLLDEADADPSADAVTRARLAVAEAKAFGGATALEIATESLELLGASSTDAAHGLDRHWRNARTHTLHDPARFKYLAVGAHLLNGTVPPPANILI